MRKGGVAPLLIPASPPFSVGFLGRSPSARVGNWPPMVRSEGFANASGRAGV